MNHAIPIIGMLLAACLTATSQAVSVVFDAPNQTPIIAPGYDATGQGLDISLNFAPPAGTNLTVLRNTGTAYIQGTFTGIPNGAEINLVHEGTTYSYVAWYYGGDGNDLVLHWRYAGLAGWGFLNHQRPFYAGVTYHYPKPAAVRKAGVLTDKTIVQVALGYQHTLVLTSEGRVYAWGDNEFGQLGDNTLTFRADAVAVNTAEGISALHDKTVVAISAGAHHSLALSSDGTVAAWGVNGGRVGDGTTPNRAAPVMVRTDGSSALAGKFVTSISAGYVHSLAVCSDGTIVGWGDNSFGQLGNNQQAVSLVPVAPAANAGMSALEGRSVVSASAGDMFSVALCSDGTVVAWGNNSNGELGDTTTTRRHTPGIVNTAAGTSALHGKTVVSIVAGSQHVLALCSDGTVAAWGDNLAGQVGDGTKTDRLSPVAVDTSSGSSHLAGRTVVAVAAGMSQSVVLCSDGSVAAWGFSSYVGDNSHTDRVIPGAVSTEAGASVLSGRKVTALGHGNAAGCCVAIYHADAPGMVVEDPAGVPLVDGTGSFDLGVKLAGSTTTKVLTIRNTSGLPLSLGTVMLDGADPAAFTLDVTSMAPVLEAGNSTTFLVKFSPLSAGDHAATIHIHSNALGPAASFDIGITGSASTQAAWHAGTETPFTVESLNATGVTIDLALHFAPPAGSGLTLVRNTGRDFIQGAFANLPEGATVQMSHGGIHYSYVAWYHGGDGNDLVLLWPHMGLAMWGSNHSGQLGDSSNDDRSTPVAADQAGALLGKTVVQLARGSDHTLALTSDGTVYSWGGNVYGQLGDNTTTSSAAPVPVSRTSGISALFQKFVVLISAAPSCSLALCSDGTLVAWGRNNMGRLGDGTLIDRPAPTQVSTASALSGKTVVALAGGGSHFLALCSDGTVCAWGNNASGQLGNASTTPSPTPVAVSTATALAGKSVVAIAAGGFHSLALCSDGGIAAWGYNTNGQRGDQGPATATEPSAVSTASPSALLNKTVAAISAGSLHSMALCTDGTVATWGGNTYGQLGDNTTSLRGRPVKVSTAADVSVLSGKTVVSISAGAMHSMALCSDGTLAAWGLNTDGQLGDTTLAQRNAPQAVNMAEGSPLAGKRPAAFVAGAAHHSGVIYSTSAPNIAVEHLLGTPLADESVISFGMAEAGIGTTKTLVVSNTGGLPLVLASSSISGADAAAFSTHGLEAGTIIQAGSTTSFNLAFTPARSGGHQAALQIAHNAPGTKSHFDLDLEGSAQTAFESWAAANNVSSDPLSLGGSNLLHFAFGTPPRGAARTLKYAGSLGGGGTIGETGPPVTLLETDGSGVQAGHAVFVRRKAHAAAGLSYHIHFSGDLREWQVSATEPFVLADDGMLQIVRVPFPPLIGGKPARFFRISVDLSH